MVIFILKFFNALTKKERQNKRKENIRSLVILMINDNKIEKLVLFVVNLKESIKLSNLLESTTRFGGSPTVYGLLLGS